MDLKEEPKCVRIVQKRFYKMNWIKEHKTEIWIVINLVIMVMVVIGFIWIIGYYKSKTFLCLKDPYVWASKEMVKHYDWDSMECSCSAYTGDDVKSFGFNDKMMNPKGKLIAKDYDLDSLEVNSFFENWEVNSL